MTQPKPFQDTVVKAISERKKTNPAYSLRHFAQTIGVTPSHLSMILEKTKFPSPELVTRIGEAIEVASETIEKWQKEIREQKKAFFFHGATPAYNESSVGTQINSWYHLAIVELFKTKNFKSAYSYISEEIGLDLQTAIEAVSALERNQIISTETTPWSVTASSNSLMEIRTAIETREMQKDLLEIAIGAIDNVDDEDRDNTSVTMAIQKDKLAEAKEMIKKFSREMAEFLKAEDGKADEVYHLTVGLFPTKIQDEE